MKVILLKDIPKIGRRFDIKEVNDGYARNFLMPKKLIEMATPQKVKEIEEMKKGMQIEQKIQDDLLDKNIEALNGLELIIKEKVSDAGHLFKSIHKEEIIAKMQKDYKIEISADCLVLDKPIKDLGEHIIPIKVKTKKGQFKLIVEKA